MQYKKIFADICGLVYSSRGISRFDVANFFNYSKEDGLPSNFVVALPKVNRVIYGLALKMAFVHLMVKILSFCSR